jgi:hypothetical protein
MRLKKLSLIDTLTDHPQNLLGHKWFAECRLGSTVLGSLMGTRVTDSATYLTVLDICLHGSLFNDTNSDCVLPSNWVVMNN